MKYAKTTRSLVSIGLRGAFLAGVSGMTLFATAAYAQESIVTPAGDTAQDDSTGTIVVTGSRIASPTLTSPSPLQVLSSEALENTGTINVQDALQQNPAIGAASLSRTTTGASTNPGLATVNLRNLGPDRTLVLIDGRRSVAGVPGTAQVDLSMIPTPFIERVDVLTGGASAVYGSDAVAGVVNFIYKKKFEGLQINTQAGISERGDDRQFSANATFGSNFGDGRGNFMVYGGYVNEGEVTHSSRSFSRYDYTSLGTTQRVAGNSAANQTAAENLFTPFYNPSNVGPGGIFVIGSQTNRIIESDGTFRAYNAATDGWNRAEYGLLAAPSERLTFAARTNYDVTDKVNVFGEVTYTNVLTKGRMEASPMRTDSALGAFTGTKGFYPIEFDVLVPGGGGATTRVANPFVPAAVFAAATDRTGDGYRDLSFLTRTTAFGTRTIPTERDNFRAVLGTSVDLGSSWQLDAYYQYGFTKQNQSMSGLANLYNLAEGLQVITDIYDFNQNGSTTDAVCASAEARGRGCVPINVYGMNTLTPEMVDYLQVNMSRHSKQDMQVAAVNLTGSLFNLPAGPVQVAVGGEYRRESSRDIFDPLTNAARNGYVQMTDTAGSFNVKEAYGEIVVPVLSDTPFFRNLTLRGAGRMSDYSTVGTFYAWNVGAEWAPIEDIRFRAVYAHAVRAPNIGELFAAPAAGIVTITDPCQGVTLTTPGATADNCRAVPGVLANIQANGAFTLTQADLSGVGGVTAANPNIREEKGKTLTLGAVVNPRSIHALRNLTFTADYFDIKLEDAISRVSAATVLNKCYGGGFADFCQFVTRRSVASGAYSIGSVEQVVRGLINSGGSYTRGLDFTLSYSHDLFGGQAGISAAWTHLLKNGYRPLTGDPKDNTMGELGVPRDPITVGLNWANETFGFTLNNEYISSQVLDYENFQTLYRLADGSVPDAKYFTIKSKIYTDMQARFTGMENFEFYIGVKNMFDTKRPPIWGGLPGNANAVYDVIGRRFYTGVRVKF
ncbi:TonB-dependent receptor plug domain-containing protein [Hephaestia sp. GCM10023244]|uniref:TonB-dependent receptor plug domain-containing protein n=1 Tax=unclassified Hephaestia TaxID=2631281 RepID=UPI002076F670|nr:TonB-dependent receptor [Hephaestia sp. MAHUQ-44]MCM8732164.1 TonB-dependent receptor [Hephaestia sp. MAHUQ-44]